MTHFVWLPTNRKSSIEKITNRYLPRRYPIAAIKHPFVTRLLSVPPPTSDAHTQAVRRLADSGASRHLGPRLLMIICESNFLIHLICLHNLMFSMSMSHCYCINK